MRGTGIGVKRTIARLAAAGLLLVAWSLAALAQPAPRVYRIGFVSPSSAGPTFDAFRQGLRESGYVEGQNVIVEARFADGRSERTPELVADVLRLKLDVLVVGSSVAALAASKATTTVPIVFAGLIDPIATGIVTSLARPGGNITGTTFGIGGAGYFGKWVEGLKEAAPEVSHVAALWNAANPANAALVAEMQAAARTLKVRLDLFDAGNPAALAAALAAIGAGGARGLIVTNDPFFLVNRQQLVAFAAGKRLPAMYFSRDFVVAGGLMSYGSSVADSYQRAAAYVDRILKGAKPADLPIDQPTRFDLVINLKTARALGLAVPRSLLVRADQVID
jgi:putative ABC transport system substrate-binding protein